MEKAMLAYLENYLIQHNGDRSARESQPFRSRIGHTRRVLAWIYRLLDALDDPEEVDVDVLVAAAIFHDIGYQHVIDNTGHAARSAEIFQAYALENALDPAFAADVLQLISFHSRKELLREEDTPLELILLMEADLLDEEGAMGVARSLMALGFELPDDYQAALTRLQERDGHILGDNPMVTPAARAFWEEKQSLVDDFLSQLDRDLDTAPAEDLLL